MELLSTGAVMVGSILGRMKYLSDNLSTLSSVSITELPDGEHFVKTGPWEHINWEWHVYRRSEKYGLPIICEQFIDQGPQASILLHRVLPIKKLFETHAGKLNKLRRWCDSGGLNVDVQKRSVLMALCHTQSPLG